MKSALLTPLLVSAASAAALPSTRVSYDGHKVFRVKPGTAWTQVKDKLSGLDLSPWKEDLYKIDVSVSPEKLDAFDALGLDCSVMHENLGQSIAQESAASKLWKRQTTNSTDWYSAYHSYDENLQYVKDLQARIPDNSKLVSSGTSYEGRDIFGLQVWGDGGPGKEAIVYHATVHAREWIATPVAEYILEQVIDGILANDADVTAVVNKRDLFVFPLVNPDGFEYSRTVDRQWRKNRQPAPNSTCIGTDINRNWAFQWNPNSGGSSSNPCDETYAGTGPASSPENAGLSSFIANLASTVGVKLYLDHHSYGQDILFPYGYNETILVPQVPKWERTGSLISAAIRDSNDRATTFTYGPGGAILYKSVGNSRDAVYGLYGADFSWTVELPDTGKYGFVLPPDQILPTVQEQWVGQQVLLPLLDEVFFDGLGSQ